MIPPVELSTRLADLTSGSRARAIGLARLAGLVALLWAVPHQLQPGVTGRHGPAPDVLTALAALGWIGWMAGRRLDWSAARLSASLALMAAAGGALTAYSPLAMTYVAVAALGAGVAFDAAVAAVVVAGGAAALLVAIPVLHSPDPAALIAEGLLSTAAGLLAGASRRQNTSRAIQAEQLLAERVRADAERDRAAALAERNRLGREIHDVLAHSLGALSVQLEVVDALLDGRDKEKAHQLVQQARRMAVQGLEETRQAVHALRDEPVELAEQLAALAEHEGAELEVTGAPRPLRPEVGHALYRAAQEALTNARKHAPGARVNVALSFAREATELVVSNGPPAGDPTPSTLSTTGGGFGLSGMRERVELLGGAVSARPSESGWTVQVAVPG